MFDAEVPIRVAVRVRPPVHQDNIYLRENCVYILEDSQHLRLGEDKIFRFDHIFPQHSRQHEVYKLCVESLVYSLFDGFNTSVLTYGPSNSGKTYTLSGPEMPCAMNEADFGIIPRVVRHIFYIMQDNPSRDYFVSVSYVEVYKGEVRDLLNDSTICARLPVREDRRGNTVLIGMEEYKCESIGDVLQFLQMGNAKRQISQTDMNDNSSQSHVIFTVSLGQLWRDQGGYNQQRFSKFSFVDLVGCDQFYSEPSGANLDPGLFVLNNVISSLQSQSSEIPYRESNLTRILKDIIGGNCITVMICCIKPFLEYIQESFMALQCAHAVQDIRNFPVVNIEPQPAPLAPLLPELSTNEDLWGFHESQPSTNPFYFNEIHSQNSVVEQEEEEEEQEDCLFKLKFASYQWQLLVSNAEEIFLDLLKCGTVSQEDKSRVETWLCQKHECDECVMEKEETPKQSAELEVIAEAGESEASSDPSESDTEDFDEEVKELFLKFQKRNNSLILKTENELDLHDEETEVISEDFKLDKFEDSKRDISSDNCDDPDIHEETLGDITSKHDFHPKQPSREALLKRRHTVLGLNPEEMTRIQNVFQAQNPQTVSQALDTKTDEPPTPPPRLRRSRKLIPQEQELHVELRNLGADCNMKHVKLKQILQTVKNLKQDVKELKMVIKEKESLKRDMVKMGRETEQTKRNFKKKIERLKQDKNLLETAIISREKREAEDGSRSHKMRYYEKCLIEVEKKIKDYEKVASMAGNNPRKLDDLKEDLAVMLNELQVLQDKLLKNQQQRDELENELDKNERRMMKIEQQLNIQSSMKRSSSEIKTSLKILSDEEGEKTDIEISQEKKQPCLSGAEDTSRSSSRLEYFDESSHEKLDSKSRIRYEISNLRTLSAKLIQKRQLLDVKLHKEKVLEESGNRQKVELDEAVEAVDVVIENKNKMICSWEQELSTNFLIENQSDDDIISKLVNLSSAETRCLLKRYFLKVVDLRIQYENHEYEIDRLKRDLQQERSDARMQCTELSRKYQNEMRLLLNNMNADSSSGSHVNQHYRYGHQMPSRNQQRSLQAAPAHTSSSKHHTRSSSTEFRTQVDRVNKKMIISKASADRPYS